MEVKDINKLFEEYARECEFTHGLRPETIRGYRATFELFKKIIPGMSLGDLRQETMACFFERIKTRKRIVGKGTEKIGVRQSTIRTYWSKLNSFFAWLQLRGYIENNPLPKMKIAEPVYDDHRAMEREDINKLLAAVTMHSKNPLILRRDTLIISILFFAGLRKGELLGLQFKDIDMGKRVLTVRGETSKSKRTRCLPINPTLLMHLQEYIRERNKKGYKTEYLIASDNEDKQLTAHGMKHWVSRLSRLSGVKFHLHRFRHSFACELGKDNVGVIKLQQLLGHTDLRMTQRYVRSLSVEDLRDDVNRLTY